MEPIGYLILGTVIAIAAIGACGYLIVKRVERKMNSKQVLMEPHIKVIKSGSIDNGITTRQYSPEHLK